MLFECYLYFVTQRVGRKNAVRFFFRVRRKFYHFLNLRHDEIDDYVWNNVRSLPTYFPVSNAVYNTRILSVRQKKNYV